MVRLRSFEIAQELDGAGVALLDITAGFALVAVPLHFAVVMIEGEIGETVVVHQDLVLIGAAFRTADGAAFGAALDEGHVGLDRTEKGIILRSRGNAAHPFVFGKIRPEVAVRKGMGMDQKSHVLQVRGGVENHKDLVGLGIGPLAVLRELTRSFPAAFVEEYHGRFGFPVEGLRTDFVDFFVHVAAGDGKGWGG